MLSNQVVAIAFCFLVFALSKYLYSKVKFALFNPVLLSIIALIAMLKISNTDYVDFMQGGGIISFFLKPAVVALGLPLYLEIESIKKKGHTILFSIISGSLMGISCVLVLSYLFNISESIKLSMIPLSITTPIAMSVSESLGGLPPLTAAMVVTVGIIGSIVGLTFLKKIGVKNSKAVGLAMGAAAHGLGTAKVATKGKDYSAYGGLAMALNGIITAILASIILQYFA